MARLHWLGSGCKLVPQADHPGPVVQKPVNANLGLKVNQGFYFSR